MLAPATPRKMREVELPKEVFSFGKQPDIVAPRAGYDAVTSTAGQRLTPGTTIRSEDNELSPRQRQQLVWSVADLHRNFELVGWALRRHCNHTCGFKFQSNNGLTYRSKDLDRLDDRIEDLIEWRSRDYNVSPAGNFSLSQFIHIAELLATVYGDVGILKLDDGRMQLIESDRVRTPAADAPGVPKAFANDPSIIQHGILVGPGNEKRAYYLHDRNPYGGYDFSRRINARNVIWHGHYVREDQIRGVSPLAPAINRFRDIYEAESYALGKLKVSQLFSMVIFRDAVESNFFANANDQDDERPDYPQKLDAGQGILNLAPGDDAKFLSVDTPGTSSQQFIEQMIRQSLLALDIPYTQYDVTKANYSSARQDWVDFDKAKEPRRNKIKTILNRLTIWWLSMWIADGTLELPVGMQVHDIAFEWVEVGRPWIDPLKEVKAEIEAINAGLDNPEDVSRRHGKNVYENIEKIARVMAFAKEHGVVINSQNQQAILTGELPSDEPELEETEADDDADN